MPGKNDGLNQGVTADLAPEYTDAFQRGCDLVERHINLLDREPTPSPAKEAEVEEGIRLLQHAVAIEPRSWPALWMIGKGHQALGDHPKACEAFRQATRLCKHNADVPRELCLEYLHLGQFQGAVEVARQAMQLKTSDAGLQANLALALILAGDVDEALDQAEQESARDPKDQITCFLLNVIREIKDGRRSRPKTLAELEA